MSGCFTVVRHDPSVETSLVTARRSACATSARLGSGNKTGLIRRAARLLLAILRELADENAYQRYLSARGLAPSAQAWRCFSNARLAARFERPKCC